MIKPICERGRPCIYLEIKNEEYSYPIRARSSILRKGRQISYYCRNKKKFGWRCPKLLSHEEKFKGCSFKVTDKLEVFI